MTDRNRGSGSSAGEVEVDPRRINDVGDVSARLQEAGGQAFTRSLRDMAPQDRPLGIQPPPIPPPSAQGEMAMMRARQTVSPEDTQRVKAALAFHIGGKLPGIEWTNAIDPLADRALQLAGDNPGFLAALEADVNAMYALTDEQVAERLMRGQPVGQFTDLWDAVAEVSWEIGATDLAARLEAERADAVKGTFDGLTQQSAMQVALEDIDPETVGPHTRVDPRGVKAQTFATLFDVPGAWSYSPASGVLAVTVGEQTVGVDARPGFDPQDHLDVMAEVVAAQADGRIVGGALTGGQGPGNIDVLVEKAHEVGGWLEEHPVAGWTVDRLWTAFTPGDDEREPFGTEKAQLEERRETITEESVRMASAVPFPVDATIAAVARQIMGDREDLTSADALAEAAGVVDENRDQFVSEFERLTQEELVAELEEGLEGASPLGQAIEGSLQNTLEVFETWDLFTQTIGINFIDTIRDLYAAGDVVFEGGTWQEGFEHLQKVFQPAEPSDDTGRTFLGGLPAITAADYFDLEGGAADGANLAVGIGFDPINLIFPGAKGIRAAARRALTNPKYAGLYLKTGSFPSIARSIAGVGRGGRFSRAAREVADDVAVPPGMSAGEAEAVFGVGSDEAAAVAAREAAGQTAAETTARGVRNVIASSSGMDAEDIIDLLKIARDPNGTVDQVNAVWTRALAKDWIPDTAGRPIRHSTVEGIGRTLDSIAEGRLSGEARDTMMKMVAKLSVSRTVRLGEASFLDEFGDLLVQFFPADKDKLGNWFMDAATRMSEAGDPLALKGAAQLQKEQARRAASETGGAVRSINLGAGGDLRGVQQNLRQIENALATLGDQPVVSPLTEVDDATRRVVEENMEVLRRVIIGDVRAEDLRAIIDETRGMSDLHRDIVDEVIGDVSMENLTDDAIQEIFETGAFDRETVINRMLQDAQDQIAGVVDGGIWNLPVWRDLDTALSGGPKGAEILGRDPDMAALDLFDKALATLKGQPLDRITIRESLEKMHAIMSRRAAEASPRIAEQQAKRRVAQKQLKQATWLENDVANQTRNQMGALVFELYDDVARQLNEEFLEQFGEEIIPIVKGKINPLSPEVPVRDWSRVTGVAKDVVTDEDELALLMGLAVDDADVSRGLSAVGAFNRTQKVVLPASPYEVIAFQKLAKNESALQTWTKLLRSDWMKTVAKTMKGAFAANLLLNPLTAGKITLDETLRFFADTGEFSKFARATAAGLPGVGRGTEGIIQRVASKYGDQITNPYALAYKRNVGGWSADDFADYGWVERPDRGVTTGFRRKDYREQAERWVNGTLLQDRRFREYARWIDDAQVLEDGTKIPPQEFIDWWENGTDASRPGRADVRQTTVTIRDHAVVGDELTATDAFNIIDGAFNHWLDVAVDGNQRHSLQRTLMEAARGARGPLDVDADAHLFNAIKKVPGLQGKDGFGSRVFNVFFGGPSGRRAGVFYEHYFDEAMEILTERHAGRIIGVDEIMEAGNVDRQTAQHYLKQGAENRVVAELIANTGAKTEAQLAARAARYAERRSDDLMYRFTSASLAGRGVESALMFPFARAQVDFLSWWSDYMTRPMNLFGKLPPQAKARLPGMVQDAMNAVDRIPINLRAWAKFSHMASAVSNEHPSVVDQTIDSLTFFPLRFDSEFLMDVSPQFGPMPSWLFDLSVDAGVIDEATEANFEAIFPALGFTELEDDPFTDAFNRIISNSRRSLRDLGVTGLRNLYAFRGQDVFTDPGAVGQFANFLADNKVPAATGDFQAALVSDLLKVSPNDPENVWSLVPGSDEWNQRMNQLAVEGALQANQAENWQDFRDRIFPVADYDREYRALQGFEGMLEDDVFGDLVSAGVFQQNDLLDQDGQPRIAAVWEKYQEGQATNDELAWLDDRLTTAYFEAGRLEVLPGFSYMDWLNINHPELTVNLINKSEDSGIPVRSDEHADFKQKHINRLTGRLQNVPPGDTGREMIADARRRGWLVSRPVEEWATDAAEAAYKSGQRAVRGVWEWVSHRTWAAGTKKSIEDKTFVLGDAPARVLEAAGLAVEAGTQFTYKEFYDLLDAFDERFDVAQPTLIDSLQRGAVHSQLARHDDVYGMGLIEALGEAEKQWRDAGVDSIDDWSEDSKAQVREAFGEAINLGYTTLADYEQEIEPIFGPLDYQPPVPPPVAELDQGIRLTGDELGDVEVLDGDTVSVLLADGPMRVRLIGINAPEVTQDGYSEARSNLAGVVAQADEVVLGFYEPETFGLTQLSAPGERRLLAWLYVDGVPLYDPSVFTADNPRGAGVGGSVLDLQAILNEGRSE